MRNLLINTCFGAAVLVADAATANEELIKMSQNPKDWVMPTGTTPTIAIHSSSRSPPKTSANCRWRGRFRLAFCVATKAGRS